MIQGEITSLKAKGRVLMLTRFLDYTKSFALARVLMAAIELDIFPILDKEPIGRSELKIKVAIADTPIADAVIDILVAFDFITEVDGELKLTPLGASVLPVYESIKSWNKEMQLFYSSLDDLTGVLKSGHHLNTVLSDYWAYKKSSERKKLHESAVDDYSSVMEASQVQLSEAIVELYDLSTYKHVIDFGGGYGRFAITLADRYLHLGITVADLPAVCEGARARIDAAGLRKRIKCLAVDFLHDDLPSNIADVIIFVRVLHDWNDLEVADLISRTQKCLRKPGVALIVEPMTDDNVKPDPGSVLSSLMLPLFGGRRRTVQQYMEILQSAGYTNLRWRECGLSAYKMIEAYI